MLLVRFLQSLIILSLLGIALVVFQSGAVSARQGVFVKDYLEKNSDQQLTFSQPEISRNFYGELKGSGLPGIFAFKGSKNFLLRAKIYIPALKDLQNFRPGLALFGPGLPEPRGRVIESLPFTLPAGAGVVISEEKIEPGTPPLPLVFFNEPFTQSNYYEGQEILRDLPQEGTYYLAVFSQAGQSGKYALQVGDKDDEGFKEILGFPYLWTRVHLWFDDWVTPAAVWALLAFLVLIIVLRFARPNLLSKTYLFKKSDKKTRVNL